MNSSNENNDFIKGLKDGIPIFLGYIPVAFALGIFAVSVGLGTFEIVLMSMTTFTSAGPFAAVPIIAGGGGLFELAISQTVINLRYSVMSMSLSQKLGKSVSFADRFLISFLVTDEIFAVSALSERPVGRKYMFGLILMPYVGWSVGTLFGALAGNILPDIVVSALGIAIYGMFIAIIVPPAKKNKTILLCVLGAVVCGCLFEYLPVLSGVSSGFVIIISSVVVSAVFSFLAPVPDRDETVDPGNAV